MLTSPNTCAWPQEISISLVNRSDIINYHSQAILNLEPTQGDASLIGWEGRKVTALTAALLNGTFIQGFELDDWHSEAPLHSNSIILPALLAAAEQANAQASHFTTSGKDFLLATIAGYETGPRVGRSLWGTHVLSSGWHSGAVFGPAAASVSKLYGLDADTIEDAFGIACTQSCGLMSAQFESDVKRMHHGFAARNGLLAAVLAQGGYVGIKMKRFDGIKKIDILLGEAAFHHGGWRAARPLTATGAQMSNSFTAATQIVHGQVLMPQFTPDTLVDEDAWRLVDLTECKLHITDGDSIGCQEVRIRFEDGTVLHHSVPSAFGVEPPLSNDDIVAKWRQLTRDIVENEVVGKIEEIVLSLEEQDDLVALFELILQTSKNPLTR
ncbi:hypothetical protein BFJ71_g10435 [Fusarium oxysporum]|nr:hypothetical protein BFJ67_g4803 [Fusarium oxysporum f. sp. cepae]RKK92150.1 hypothetical protein BFJ71_g10435 [Fusarium oxysporum]